MTTVTGRNSPSSQTVITMDQSEYEDRERDLAAEYAIEAFLDEANEDEMRRYRQLHGPKDLVV